MRTLVFIAVGYEMTGRLEEARTTKLEVLAMARQDGEERTVTVSSINLAETEFVLGEIESAAQRLEALLASKATRKDVRLRANARANLAVYLIALHREKEARATARAALFDAREAGDAGTVAVAMQHLAAMLSHSHPRAAAKLLGYVDGVFAQEFQREHTERYTHGLLMEALHARLSAEEIATMVREGATMAESQAIRIAMRSYIAATTV